MNHEGSSVKEYTLSLTLNLLMTEKVVKHVQMIIPFETFRTCKLV